MDEKETRLLDAGRELAAVLRLMPVPDEAENDPLYVRRLHALTQWSDVANSTARPPEAVSSPVAAYRATRHVARLKKERLIALYLDAQNNVIARETISVGSLNTVRTHPREILKPAIDHQALSFILVHNHPSGSLSPSQDDIDFTRAVRRAAEIIGISLYDHLIIAKGGYVSMKEKGLC